MPLNKEKLKEVDTERRNDESGSDYLLAVGEAAARRLLMPHEIFGPHSRELLRRARLAQGMRVADIGCGTGLASLWIAAQLGAVGSVRTATSCRSPGRSNDLEKGTDADDNQPERILFLWRTVTLRR